MRSPKELVRTCLSSGSPAGVRLAAACCALLLGASPPGHAEWAQWRGTERDGCVSVSSRQQEWPARPVTLWEREVGEGYSGPLVAGNQVWVHARQGEQEIVSSLSLDEGDILWSQGYDAPFGQDPDAKGHGSGPYATPALAEGRLFTLGVKAVLSAWDAAAGGLLWRRDYSDELDPSYPYFGAAGSPLVWGDLCFVHFGSSEEQKPNDPGRGAMVALRVQDGKEVWRWDIEGPALGASPVVREIGGRWQLVFKSQEMIVGVDPRNGEELWRIPFKVAMDNTIVTPLFVGDRIVTSDYEMGFFAWHIETKGGTWAARQLWKQRKVSLFTSSPVVAAGQVVGLSQFKRGQLFGLNPSNGEVLWQGQGRWGEHASLIAWGDQVLVFKEDGSLVIGEVSEKGFRIVRSYRLGRPKMWSHPAVVDNRVLIRDGTRLAAYQF